MATSCLPLAMVTRKKQFMRGQQVVLLYRRILHIIQQVPEDSDRKYLKDWSREEFKGNISATEEDTIQMMITQGYMQLKELEKKPLL
ncbi:LYR motif-containing protein 2-like [Choloepus didactylus]|uniref:LYR motif-containing protein 2-like n=1 Tax=Choloepus didactylus TaxID=27675 RepID=UPI00189E5C5E|nr:LYR motif-containing protein 2-like [Choloepus didactylus]